MSDCIKCGMPCVTDELEVWCPTCAANEIDRLTEEATLAQVEIEQMSRVLNRLHAKGGIVAYSGGEWLVIGGEDG
jgi:uncharacterized Zn finger protein (UPF0148 family)